MFHYEVHQVLLFHICFIHFGLCSVDDSLDLFSVVTVEVLVDSFRLKQFQNLSRHNAFCQQFGIMTLDPGLDLVFLTLNFGQWPSSKGTRLALSCFVLQPAWVSFQIHLRVRSTSFLRSKEILQTSGRLQPQAIHTLNPKESIDFYAAPKLFEEVFLRSSCFLRCKTTWAKLTGSTCRLMASTRRPPTRSSQGQLCAALEQLRFKALVFLSHV